MQARAACNARGRLVASQYTSSGGIAQAIHACVRSTDCARRCAPCSRSPGILRPGRTAWGLSPTLSASNAKGRLAGGSAHAVGWDCACHPWPASAARTARGAVRRARALRASCPSSAHAIRGLRPLHGLRAALCAVRCAPCSRPLRILRPGRTAWGLSPTLSASNAKGRLAGGLLRYWRRGWDSNPRCAYTHA